MSYATTPQQTRALDAIKASIATTGMAPTMKELASTLGLNSHASARRLVVELIARGHVKQIPSKRRALTIVAHCPHCGEPL